MPRAPELEGFSSSAFTQSLTLLGHPDTPPQFSVPYNPMVNTTPLPPKLILPITSHLVPLKANHLSTQVNKNPNATPTSPRLALCFLPDTPAWNSHSLDDADDQLRHEGEEEGHEAEGAVCPVAERMVCHLGRSAGLPCTQEPKAPRGISDKTFKGFK